MENKEFDDLIKAKLFDFQVEKSYDENTWDDRYALALEESRRKSGIFWKYLRGGLYLLLWATFAFLPTSTATHWKERVLVQTTSGAIEDTNLILVSQEKLPRSQPKSEIRINQEEKTPELSGFIPSHISKTGPTAIEKSSALSHQPLDKDNQDDLRIDPARRANDSILALHNQKLSNYSQSTVPMNAIQTPVAHHFSIESEWAKKTIHLIDKQGLDTNTFTLTGSFPNFSQVAVPKMNLEPKGLGLSLGLEYNYLWSKPKGGFTENLSKTGILAELHWGRWSLLTGFSTQQYGYNLTDKNTAVDYLNQFPYFNLSADNIKGGKVQIAQSQIPLTLRYQLPIRGRWALIAGMGVHFEKKREQNYRYDAEEFLGGAPVTYQINLRQKQGQFQLTGLEAGLDLGYRLNHRLSIQSGIAYLPGLRNAGEENSLEANQWAFKVRLLYKLWQK